MVSETQRRQSSTLCPQLSFSGKFLCASGSQPAPRPPGPKTSAQLREDSLGCWLPLSQHSLPNPSRYSSNTLQLALAGDQGARSTASHGGFCGTQNSYGSSASSEANACTSPNTFLSAKISTERQDCLLGHPPQQLRTGEGEQGASSPSSFRVSPQVLRETPVVVCVSGPWGVMEEADPAWRNPMSNTVFGKHQACGR